MTKSKELFRTSAALAALLALGACSSDLRQSPVPDAESPALSAQATALPDIRIADSAGDAEQLASGNVLLASSVLELGTRSDGPQTVGLRFPNVTIPKGSDIVTAYLDFVASSDQVGSASLRFQGLAATNPAAFTATANDVGSRARTAASVTWAPPAWTAGTKYSTINLAGVVEEITNRADWTGNAALALVVTGSGIRQAHSWDASNTLQPVLRITYNPPLASCLSGKTPRSYSGPAVANVQGLPVGGAAKLTSPTFEGNNARSDQALTIRNNGQGLCVSGGTYTFTDVNHNSPWDSGGPVVYVVNSKNVTIERMAVKYAYDGLGIAPPAEGGSVDHADGLKITDSYIYHALDDAVENDQKMAFTINNTLIDWAHTGISCRSGSRSTPGAFRISNTLLALKTQASGAAGPNTYFHPFKWETASNPCPLYLDNVTVYMEQRNLDRHYTAALFNPVDVNPATFVKECRNVTVLYGGTEASYYTTGARKNQIDQLRAAFPGCLTVKYDTEARNLWNTRRQDWFSKLPSTGFEHITYYQNRDPKPQ